MIKKVCTTLLKKYLLLVWAGLILFTSASCTTIISDSGIDRYTLVNRHNILVPAYNPLASLSVGNGNFAFTTDITGLQTFYKDYEEGVSLGTQSNWGWHTTPGTSGYEMRETFRYFEVDGRQIPYQDQLLNTERSIEAANYFRQNPHRLHLGIIRLVIIKGNGEEIQITDLQSPLHKLDLWKGEISSNFNIEGNPVSVVVYAHPQKDMISARIESPLIHSGQLAVEWLFPYAAPIHTNPGYDFGFPEKHSSIVVKGGMNSVAIKKNPGFPDNGKWNVKWENLNPDF